MRYVYPQEINELYDTIPEKYLNDIDHAPEEYRVQFDLWRKKKREYEEKVRRELFGF